MNKSLNVASTFFTFCHPSLFSSTSVAYYSLSICENEICSEKIMISVCLISYIATVALWQTILTFCIFQLPLLRLNTLLHCEEFKFEINSAEKWQPPRSQQQGNFAKHTKYYSISLCVNTILFVLSAVPLNKITVTDIVEPMDFFFFLHIIIPNLLLNVIYHTQIIRKIC